MPVTSGLTPDMAKYLKRRNDDLSDAHGICSTLYQDLAKEVFGESEGIFFCTEVSPMDEGIVGKPLGEWP